MRQFPALVLLAAACNPAATDPPSDRQPPPANPVTPAEPAKGSQAPSEEPGFARMGQVPCVTRAGWRLRECTAGVARAPGGGAVVTIFHPEGRSRDILFDRSGRATGVRTAEADGSDRQPFSASRAGGITIVRLGPERYEVPDSLLRAD